MPKVSSYELIKRIRLLGRAVGLVWRTAPGWTLASLVLMVVQSALPLASLYLLKRIIDTLTSQVGAGGGDWQALRVLLALALGVAVLGALCRSLSELAVQAQGLQVTDAVYDVLHAQSVAVNLGYYEDPAYFDTLHRAQQEAPYRPVRILHGLTQAAQNSLSLLGIAGLLLSFNPLLGLLLMAAVLPGGLLRLVYAGKTFALQQAQTGSERRAWYYHWLLVSAEHAKEVRLFRLGARFQERFAALRREIRESRLALDRRRVGVDFLAGSFSHLAVYAVLAAGAAYALQGRMSLGDVLMIFMGFQSGIGFMQGALAGVNSLYEDSLFLGNFYDFLDLQPQTPAGTRPAPEYLREGLIFRGVSFRYPRAEEPALEDIDLELRPGQVIALVGENGSGKTTLIKLLCGLYRPDSGRITLDGIDLAELDPVAWRRELGVIFQDFAHYQLSAAENIRLGDVDCPPDDIWKLTQAARQAGAEAVIQRLPQSYDTQLGNWFKNGHELSQGEWQKIALARAFLRPRQFVVLDEPTSALDPLAEAELFSKFRDLIDGRPAVLISHRFSTVQMADCIYVMSGGRIIERGSHAELMLRNGQYARMFLAQAGMYMQAA